MRIGVDLGGTKVEGARLDRTGGIAERRRIATPRGDYAATLQAVTELVFALENDAPESEAGPAKVGIGIPGAISGLTGWKRVILAMICGAALTAGQAPVSLPWTIFLAWIEFAREIARERFPTRMPVR